MPAQDQDGGSRYEKDTTCLTVEGSAQSPVEGRKTDIPLDPTPSQVSCRNQFETPQHAEEKKSGSQSQLATPDSNILSTPHQSRGHSCNDDGGNKGLFASMTEQLARFHRTSDSSSGLVRSMKTASFTNASFSIVPRSSRMGRSTDSYIFHGSQSRYSIESDRPLSSKSFDDAALKRGFKRQQIIDELISTEEGYVSDLKALVYLYSTLLASTSTIPNKVRAAIEQNVTSILLLHEDVLTRFHQARLQAAARRWADTEVPAQLGIQRQSHLRHSERSSHTRHSTVQRRTRSSVDSAEVFAPYPRNARSAEPLDVWEIASILKHSARNFYRYEEYCANFDILGHELQKHNPHQWPTFEAGMESLARVIMAVDHRQTGQRRGLTVSDLLIKPIQRLTKYPLIVEQLLNNTPVTDAPSTYLELEMVLRSIRDILRIVNLARENPFARQEVQKRRSLQDRLDLSRLNLTDEQFRSLGSISLCGVLHVTYQTSDLIGGCYAMCVLLGEHFLIASSNAANMRLEAMAIIQLSDIKLEPSTDGKGLQSASAHFTWKLSFACNGRYHELVLSACSKIEENSWIAGLRGDFSDPVHHPLDSERSVVTCTALELKSVGVVFSSQKSLSRESSVQRAATVGGRSSISHVIIRNTHNAHDIDESRELETLISPINRSQSHMNTKRIPILEPKRSERTRLENRISDIWTRDRLPFPGMIGSRGGQMIRASAGSLVRKLSLASIHTPFSKGRTSSLSMTSRQSYDLFSDTKSTFAESRARENSNNHKTVTKPKDVPEVDDMRSVVDRMIGTNSSGPTTRISSGSKSRNNCKASIQTPGPEDPAAVFYEASSHVLSRDRDTGDVNGSFESMSVIGVEVAKRRKKRWSKHWPIDKLKEFSSEARSIFQSNSSSGD